MFFNILNIYIHFKAQDCWSSYLMSPWLLKEVPVSNHWVAPRAFQTLTHACNLNTQEAEAEGLSILSLMLAWATQWVPGQSELQSEALFQETKAKTLTQQLFGTKPPRSRKDDVGFTSGILNGSRVLDLSRLPSPSPFWEVLSSSFIAVSTSIAEINN